MEGARGKTPIYIGKVGFVRVYIYTLFIIFLLNYIGCRYSVCFYVGQCEFDGACITVFLFLLFAIGND